MKDVAAQPSKQDDHKYDEYAVRNACDTLKKAEEIREDEKMMALVTKELGKEHKRTKKAIRSIGDLRQAAYEKSKEPAEDEESNDLSEET